MLFPSRKLIYRSELQKEAIIQKLEENLEPRKIFSLKNILAGRDRKLFEGTIKGDTFNINRIIFYRNAFLPRIKGQVEKNYAGSKIQVKFHLHFAIKIFLVVWYSVTGLASGVIFASFFKQNQDAFRIEALIPFGMLVIVYLISYWSFRGEANRAQEELGQIWQASIENH